MFINLNAPAPQSKAVLGGKGYGLWEMKSLGINVPPAIILPTTACAEYQADPLGFMAKLEKALPAALQDLKGADGSLPLLSVRSGARVSMPGMMDTILNIGLSSANIAQWVKKLDADCATACRLRLNHQWKSLIDAEAKEAPVSVEAQILSAIEMVLVSWDNPRAETYRKMYGIPYAWGTAVIVQAMVFGNRDEDSATGVLFTRDPDSGAKEYACDWLQNAQGEDVVDGSHNCRDWSELYKVNSPLVKRLDDVARKLEDFYRDAQDIEWTVESGKLFILQTRTAKRTAQAAVAIAVDMVNEGKINKTDAFYRVSRRDFYLATVPVVDPKFKEAAAYIGKPASSGVVTGKVVLTSQDAIDCKVPCILVTEETNPDDIAGMNAAVGVLTMKGGATSHAAVVARGMNKPCVVGLGASLKNFQLLNGNDMIISICGATGRVWDTAVPVIAGASTAVATFTEWMFGHLGALPINEGPGSPILVDLSEDILLDPEGAVKTVATLAVQGRQVLVKLLPTNWQQDQNIFYDMLGMYGNSKPEADFLSGLVNAVSAKYRANIKLLGVISPGFGVIPSTSTLEDLMLMETDSYWEGEMTKVVAKAMALRKTVDGITFKTIGVPGVAEPVLSLEQVVGQMLG